MLVALTWMSSMEIAATRCILAAMERQLMASSRGAHGLCSNCAPKPRGQEDQTEFLHKSWQNKRHLSRSYRQLALGEEAIHVVES